MADMSDGVPNRAEPDPWQAAIDCGIDVHQLEDNLRLSPTQRLERHDRALELVRALRQAGIDHYGFDP